jgi:hypothetical protein
MLDAGMVNVKLHSLLGGVPLPPEADARTNPMPATTMAQVAMMMALRFILNRHRSLFVLYGLSRAVPFDASLFICRTKHQADSRPDRCIRNGGHRERRGSPSQSFPRIGSLDLSSPPNQP